MTPPSGRVRPCEEAKEKNTSRRALPPKANWSVSLQNQITAAVAVVSQWSIYPSELATGHLSPGQCLLLALLQSLVSGQKQASTILVEMVDQIPQLRSSFLKVWLADDYDFRKEWLAQAMSTAASMVQEGSISLESPVLAAFSCLPAKYGLAGHFVARGDLMALGLVTYIANDLAARRAGQAKPAFSKGQDKSETVIADSRLQINDTRHLPERYGANMAAQQRLMWAAEMNILASAKTALYEGANVNLPEENGHTPLSLAALKGSKNVAEVLLASGASINSTTDIFGASALCLAAMAGHDGMLRLLLAKYADTAAVDDHGLTPLHRAAECGRSKCIMELLAEGANVNARAEDHRASTPLQLAAEQGNLESVVLLLEYGADKNAIDNYGWTALTGASIKGHKTVSEVLMSNGAIDITRINKFLNPVSSFLLKS